MRDSLTDRQIRVVCRFVRVASPLVLRDWEGADREVGSQETCLNREVSAFVGEAKTQFGLLRSSPISH